MTATQGESPEPWIETIDVPQRQRPVAIGLCTAWRALWAMGWIEPPSGRELGRALECNRDAAELVWHRDDVAELSAMFVRALEDDPATGTRWIRGALVDLLRRVYRGASVGPGARLLIKKAHNRSAIARLIGDDRDRTSVG